MSGVITVKSVASRPTALKKLGSFLMLRICSSLPTRYSKYKCSNGVDVYDI